MQRIHTITLASLAAVLAAGAAIPSGLRAQGAEQDSRFQLRTMLGRYVPAGEHGDELEGGYTLGIQGAMSLTDNLDMVATGAWSASGDHTMADDEKLSILHYDIGAELHITRMLRHGLTLKPFIGAGAGGRTYDYSEQSAKAETDLVGYGSAGLELGRARYALRIEARGYTSGFNGLTGELESNDTRNDVVLTAGFNIHL